ncbi:MAG: hypothetical protein EBZ50_11825 [Alphaproteobacteria bacterium]|nr:hypothetical protein [Alphaproteobacteria bacterium]
MRLGVRQDAARRDETVGAGMGAVGGQEERRQHLLAVAHQADGGVDLAHPAAALGDFKLAVPLGGIGPVKRIGQPAGRDAEQGGDVGRRLRRAAVDQDGRGGGGRLIVRADFGRHGEGLTGNERARKSACW